MCWTYFLLYFAYLCTASNANHNALNTPSLPLSKSHRARRGDSFGLRQWMRRAVSPSILRTDPDILLARRRKVFSSDEELDDVPPNFYYSSARHPLYNLYARHALNKYQIHAPDESRVKEAKDESVEFDILPETSRSYADDVEISDEGLKSSLDVDQSLQQTETKTENGFGAHSPLSSLEPMDLADEVSTFKSHEAKHRDDAWNGNGETNDEVVGQTDSINFHYSQEEDLLLVGMDYVSELAVTLPPYEIVTAHPETFARKDDDEWQSVPLAEVERSMKDGKNRDQTEAVHDIVLAILSIYSLLFLTSFTCLLILVCVRLIRWHRERLLMSSYVLLGEEVI